jgi:hypothetical protein
MKLKRLFSETRYENYLFRKVGQLEDERGEGYIFVERKIRVSGKICSALAPEKMLKL